jgi:ubiquinone biosynthesis protein
VLVMEYIDGVNPCDFEALDRIGVDRKVLTARAADLLLQQIFVHGFFHADPHPGNILVLPGNVLCYLDFGMMGRLDRRAREDFASLVLAIAQRNGAAATQALLRIAERDDGVEIDVRRLERDVTNLIDVHLPRQLQELDLGHLFHEIIQLTEAHRLRIPPDMVVMLKALSTMESVGRTLNPEFDIVTAATPYVRRVKLERFAPGRLAADFWESSAELLELAREIPTGLRDLLAMARKGDLKIGFEHRGLEKLLETHDQIANRIVFAIVVAALIVGSSVIVHARIPPLWEGIPVIGLAGYITAGVLGFWILIAMLRHGRM